MHSSATFPADIACQLLIQLPCALSPLHGKALRRTPPYFSSGLVWNWNCDESRGKMSTSLAAVLETPFRVQHARSAILNRVSSKVKFDGRPVWAEISLAAIRHNLRVIRRQVGRERKVLAVVKANAYGLGAVDISRALARAGTDWFGVTSASEGAGIAPRRHSRTHPNSHRVLAGRGSGTASLAPDAHGDGMWAVAPVGTRCGADFAKQVETLCISS